MTSVPEDIINHCERYQACKGCPLGTCEAPVTQYPSDVWDRWLNSRVEAVRSIYE